jgi:vacuolar-type H+-ATPase subunit E/Vma4
MGLEQVIGDVRRSGEERAKAIAAQAAQEAQAILAAAREQAHAYETSRLAAAQRDAAALAAQVQSRAESEARKAVLAGEARLREDLRGHLLAALRDLPRAKREAHLKALVARAQKVVPAGSVWGSAQDTAFLAAQKAYKHAGSEPIAGGIVVESQDGQTRLDLSYETILAEAWRDVLKAEAKLFA